MSQSQYLKLLERELNKLNRIIDQKILRGEDYRKEARNHRLILRKVHYHTRKSFGEKLVHFFFRKNIYA